MLFGQPGASWGLLGPFRYLSLGASLGPGASWGPPGGPGAGLLGLGWPGLA